MERVEEKVITLYLTSWQKRMLKDYLHAHGERLGLAGPGLSPYDNLYKMAIKIPDIHIVTYRMPEEDFVVNFYLADEQISMMADALGVKPEFSAIQIAPEMVEKKIISFE